MLGRAGASSTGYALRVFRHANNTNNSQSR